MRMACHTYRIGALACFAALAACSDDGSTSTGASNSGGSTTAAASTGDATTGDATTGGPTTGVTTSDGSVSGSTGPGSTGDVTTGGTTVATTGPDPFCGDGVTDAGEECDDGNMDDADACTNACKNAVCGDGIVGPGEACDDGNMVDDDACTNACAPAGCGDAIVQAGEECDDGNMDDTDACLSTCKNAVCGDMAIQAGAEECDDGNMDDTDACVTGCKNAKCGDTFVQAGKEECDDGNMADNDACSNMCVKATCMDKVKNGSELDVDCGGPDCAKCGLGQACGMDADCGVGVCLKNKCVSNKSCKSLFDGDNTLKDGQFSLDPDEGGPNPAFMAYCDMTHDAGGWTLIMKSINTNFHYDDVLWENDTTLAPADFDFVTNLKKSKYQTFTTVGFGEIRTTNADNFATSYIYKLAAPVASAKALFLGPGVEVSKTVLIPAFENMHGAYDKHYAGCNPSTKYVNHGINLKKINGVAFLPDGNFCDWNGGARFGMRVNGSHANTGDHSGQGWGTYTTIAVNGDAMYVAVMKQLLWVR